MIKMKRYLPYLAALTVAVIFGFSFLFTKESLDYASPFQLLALRFTAAAITLFLLRLVGLIRLDYRGKKMGLVILLALVQPGLYFVFETLGIQQTTSSEAGMVIALIPVTVTILAYFFLKEKPGKVQLFFIIISVAGVLFIILMKGSSSIEGNYQGILIIGGAVLMAGIYNILSRMLSLNFKPVEITFIMMVTGAVLFNLIAIIQGGGDLQFYHLLTQTQLLFNVLYLGLLSSLAAFFLLNYALSYLEAARAAVFTNLTTIISILAGIFFRGEPFYWFQVIGGVMIIIGVWGTNINSYQQRKKADLPS